MSLEMSDNDQPIPLTNYEFYCHLREYPEADDFIPFTIYTVPEKGKVTLYISHTTTSEIMYDRGAYTIMYRNTVTDLREGLLRGRVTIIKNATRIL